MTLVDGPGDDATKVTVWNLEMRDPGQLRPGRKPALDGSEPVVLRAGRPAPELSRFFYQLVGGPWNWTDRLSWTDERWLAWADRPEHHLTTCWIDGVPAGYFELEQQADRVVEVAYFGMVTNFHGIGLGGWLLTRALQQAWSIDGTRKVWLHTCSLDGPAALGNYQARGMEITGESAEWRVL